jgi:hypothetical protein
MLNRAVVANLILIAALCGCREQTAAPKDPYMKAGASVPKDVRYSGDWSFVLLNDFGASIHYSPGGMTKMQLVCTSWTLKVSTLDFQPAQQWPQPKLKLSVGKFSVDEYPDLGYVKDSPNRTVISFDTFPLSRPFLDELKMGKSITLNFAEQSFTIPAPAKPMRDFFVDRCLAQFPKEKSR